MIAIAASRTCRRLGVVLIALLASCGSPPPPATRAETAPGARPVVVDSLAWGVQQTELLAPDPAKLDYFGSGVAVSGATAVVGASDKTVGANAQQGAAYVFPLDGSGPEQKLVAFGGSTVIVGAPIANRAYVFVQDGSTWTLQQELVPSDGAAGDWFGISVA